MKNSLDQLSMNFLHTAETIRDLSIVIERGTVVQIQRDITEQTTTFETLHD